MDDQVNKCTVCGETDPYPSWFCLLKASGYAKPNEPCSYSKEGKDRMRSKFMEGADEHVAP